MELFECNGVLVRLKVCKHETGYEVLIEHVSCGRYWMDEVCHAHNVFEATVPFSEQSRKEYEAMTVQLRRDGDTTLHDSAPLDATCKCKPRSITATDAEQRDRWLHDEGRMNSQIAKGEWRLVTKLSFNLSKWKGYAPIIVRVE